MTSHQPSLEVKVENVSGEAITTEYKDSEFSSHNDTDKFLDILNIDTQEILFDAIEKESPTIVEDLLKAGCNPNDAYSNGDEIDVEDENTMITPLLKAFERNRMDIAKVLLDNGAEISPALKYAKSSGKLEIIEFLLKCDADVDDINDEKCTPLHLVAKNHLWEESEQLVAMKILLENGADVNLKDSKSKTALHYAVNFGNIEIIELLLKYDADIDAVDSRKCSALHLASENDHNEVAEILLINGANANLLDEEFLTAFSLSTDEVRKYFFDYATKLDLNIRNVDGNTVFEEEIESFKIPKMIIYHQSF